ncbi:MAG TPA: MBL fold metallo-hydrolase [Acidisoma sp.]|uniref:MBL fold metallo-hydrolase n=1 Tax=Acidisoma sp. TaxID=1872115 RepID=UPI002BE0984A|nr:MBL fold metallo-hydrolase [Acidisoma sp.]HTI02765.1 MBL fold metallo-hydrolase [Acidisoma sp.]
MPFNPSSDHFDGTIFFNPPSMAPESGASGSDQIPRSDAPVDEPALAGERPRGRKRGGLVSIIRWRFRKERTIWPPLPPEPKPAGDPRAPVPPGHAAVTFIGHSSFLVRLPGLTFMTDPVFSDRCSPVSWAGPKRARPPGRRFADLPKLDLLLMSHNHYDHMDLPSLRAIQRRDDPMVVTPLGNARHLAKAGMHRVLEGDWWQELHPRDDVKVTITPARHFSARTLWDRGRSLWGGMMLETAGKRLYFAGDSGHGRHWEQIGQRLGAPDVALLPIGAYEPRSIMAPVHVNPAEAVAAHQALGARQSIGMHFGTFKLTDEPIDAPEQHLAEARAEAGVEDGAFVTLGFGETRCFSL